MMNREESIRDTHRLVRDISLGICGNLVDITLFLACFSGGYILSSLGTSKGRVNLGPLKAMLKAYPELRLKLRNALHLAKRDGFISKDGVLTIEGVEKLEEILPIFKRQPKWTGSLWLITYDVTEKRKRDRDALRRFLRGQGYGKLQESVYVAPFDPTQLVKTEIEKRRFKGEVIISKMGIDGHIGEMTVLELIANVYDLDLISDKYIDYIEKVSVEILPKDAPFLFLEYLAALRSDPQLPMELLPSDWPGTKAFDLTKQKLIPYLRQDNKLGDKVLNNINLGS